MEDWAVNAKLLCSGCEQLPRPRKDPRPDADFHDKKGVKTRFCGFKATSAEENCESLQ